MPEHIKMPAVEPVVRYLASGTDTAFQYPFPIFASEDMAVYLNGARQVGRYDVSGAGSTSGGTVVFDTAPAAGTIVTLERLLPLERMTDFLEGGDFSARAINNELDYLVASIQQVNRYQRRMLRYNDHEIPGTPTLPDKAVRAGKVLGFDGGGNPAVYEPGDSQAPPSFTPPGTGAVTRSLTDKAADMVSAKDFGAVGDGLADDTQAIQKALQSHDAVFLPSGNYLISSTINLAARKSLTGCGQSSVISCQSSAFNAIEVPGYQSEIRSLRITGGNIAIKLFGRDAECTQNLVSDVVISGPNTGIQLDGHNDGEKPCYWNNFSKILIEQPMVHGVHLTRSGAGDTPNANRFDRVRVYSKGALTGGAGFYVQHGSFSNSFIDCEANVNGASAQGCFIIGSGSNKTLLINPYAESTSLVPNIKLESGSLETSIFNLLSMSDGAAIWDLSGGEYTAYNAGHPCKNRMRRTSVTDLTAALQRYDTEYIDASGTISLDLSHSVHLVSSFGGPLTVKLPQAASAAGAQMTVKKIDASANIVTVTEEGGPGPDGGTFCLGGENDFVTVLSNGAKWFVISSNRTAGNTRYFDGSGIYDIDMAVDVYLLSSYGGALTARLPPANAPEAAGRAVTIKKTDPSPNAITVSEQGGSGPDGYAQPLNDRFDAITVVSNGGQWYIVSRFG